MPAKFERCVQDIKDKGEADGVNPWAVCHASTGELKPEEPDKLLNELDDIISGDASFPPADASYKHSGSLMVQKKPDTYGNTDDVMDVKEIYEACPDLKEIDDMLAKAAVFPKSNASYNFTGDMTTKLRPNTFGNTGNETVSIPGSLSAVKIKGKKNEAHSMQETIYKSILDNKLSHPCKCKNKK